MFPVESFFGEVVYLFLIGVCDGGVADGELYFGSGKTDDIRR